MFFSPRTSPIRKNWKPKGLPRREARTSTPSAKSCCGRETIPAVDVSKGFAALRDPAVQKIAIANPQHAPYGRAAEEALRHAGVYDAVKDRLVLGENISQAAEFVESGNADAGILALSLVLSPAMKDKGRTWDIPENLYTPIQQGAVVLRAAPNPQGARQFLDYIKMPATQRCSSDMDSSFPAKGKP